MTTDILVEETTNSQDYTKVPRAELVMLLRELHGDMCMHPDCLGALDFNVTDGPLEVTIDHWMPQAFGKANGWSMAEIWDIDNLRLMHKKCNAKKGDLIPNEDGTLPAKVTRNWKNRRAKRVNRPEICTACNAGRALQENEHCRACGSGPQPARLPRWRQVKPSECDHEKFFCWGCHLDPDLRVTALTTLTYGSESTDYFEGS